MKLFAYTRQYADETGAAVHLALMENGALTKLNHGFGVLFAKAAMNEGVDGRTRGLAKPWICGDAAHGWYVAALLRDVNDSSRAKVNPAEANKVMVTRTHNFYDYEEPEMLTLAADGELVEDVRIALDQDGKLLFCVQVNGAWRNADNVADRPVCQALWDAEDICCIDIPEAVAAALKMRLTAPCLPKEAPRYPFPMMAPRGDPMAFRWKDGYLFMATDDERDQLALKIRYADHLADIAKAEDHVIFRTNKSGDFSGCLWAPELHMVDGRLCIFFAAGMPYWYTVQSRVMWLTGSDPLDAACWSEPKRMERRDGSVLTGDGITLDMTVITSGNESYVAWSQRPITLEDGKVVCGTADLMIARLNTQEPWRLDSDPVVLTRPEYSWERMHSCVCEGPFMLRRGGRIFVTYAAALIDHTYAVGLLLAQDGSDLLDASSWHKTGYPVLHRLSVPDQLGAGHNAFVKDEYGNDVILIHALSMANYRLNPKDGRRYPCMRQVVWDDAGFPHFDAWAE